MTDLRLIHYTQKPVLIRPFRYVQQVHPYGDLTGYKPKGLWFSVEGAECSWHDWCVAERFRWENLRWEHEVVLSPRSFLPVLRIATAGALRSFHAEYRAAFTLEAVTAAIGDTPRARDLLRVLRPNTFGIDWRMVERDYAGIIIAPYLWDMRLDQVLTWYYGWDCASGCIWNPQAVEDVCLLGRNPRMTQTMITRCIHERQRWNNRRRKKHYAQMKRWTAEREAFEASGKTFTAGDAIRAVTHRRD